MVLIVEEANSIRLERLEIPRSAIRVVGLAVNIRAYDPAFETFYTKNILLNEGMRGWMALTPNQMKSPGMGIADGR